MRGLPAGTVTFLFTDVEGSTRLLHELGAAPYADALAEHRRVIRGAAARHRGVEVDTQGDAFFIAFPTAAEAVDAARELTQALEDGPLRVRVGLHTGTPLVTSEGYVGADVHRAARIAAAGHGGQVLVSAPTAALLPGDDLRDLGEHRFKDLAAPEHVFQLGDAEFPPLRSLYQTNLPVPGTPFLGRREELSEVLRLLCSDGLRLLTLTGPGGTGKTRLALQAAAEGSEGFPDGVWWVPLASLRDSTLVPDALASALGVKEEQGRPLGEAVVSRLAGRRTLLLLDNAEHLVPGIASSVSDLVAADGPTVLVTSRERLRVQAEQSYAVPSLSPDDGVELFVARARQVDPSFRPTRAVRELCRRLDDLPLALELAAARTAVFSPEELLERLSQRLDLLKGGRDADPRQETLRATIAWSYELLDAHERRLFADLGVFSGGCTYDAAEAICGADPDLLQSLLDKSLLRRRAGAAGATRYWMLETIREFAAERLDDSADADALRLRHAEFFASLAEEADPHLRRGPDQQHWYDRLGDDYDNVRAAMTFALEAAPAAALRLVGSLSFFVWARGGFLEARRWADEAIARSAGQPEQLVGRAHECAAVVSECLSDFAREASHARQAYELFAAVGDELGQANALRELGKSAGCSGELERAQELFEELAALAERIGDSWNSAIAINNLGDIALQSGEWASAVELCARSAEIRSEIGDRWGSALSLANVASAELQLGRLDEGGRHLLTALDIAVEAESFPVVNVCIDLGAVLAHEFGRGAEAARLLGASDRMLEELGAARDAFEKRLAEETTVSVRGALGDESFARERARGRELAVEDAVAAVRAIADGAAD